MICSECGQTRRIIAHTPRRDIPIGVCACDVARVWLLEGWKWVAFDPTKECQ